jgi:DNA-directed RNA polymerase specialized sigma subunit
MVRDATLIERAQAGDNEARDELVLRNRPYAVKCASSVWRARRRCCGTLLDLDDLIQECVLAILRAIDKCDVAKLKDRDLRWYAKLRCRNAIEDAIGSVPMVAVPRSTLWHYLHGNMSERGARDVADVLRRRIGRRPDLAVDQRLGPVDEARLKGD